jgi:hypothetical protein
MYEGVRSPTAKEWWEKGTCDTPSGPKSMAGPETERPESARAGRMMARPAPADAARPRFVIQF